MDAEYHEKLRQRLQDEGIAPEEWAPVIGAAPDGRTCEEVTGAMYDYLAARNRVRYEEGKQQADELAKTLRVPADGGWEVVWAEVGAQTDRGAAIMAAALVQDCLKHCVLSAFPSPDDEVRRLFGPDGPCGSFASQATLAYGMGLVGEGPRKDLNSIRKIRNKFAHWTWSADSKHEPQLVTFATQDIAAWCANLELPGRALCQLLHDVWTERSFFQASADPRSRYLATCRALAERFRVGWHLTGRIDYGRRVQAAAEPDAPS